jgi:hypothetical protein
VKLYDPYEPYGTNVILILVIVGLILVVVGLGAMVFCR